MQLGFLFRLNQCNKQIITQMAVTVSASWALLLLLLLVATCEAATLNITNRCSFTVWPAALPTGGGVPLDPGKSWALDVRAGATSRIWPRTGCSFDGKGNGACQTGDCGGVLACNRSGRPPNTLAEFMVGQGKKDFFNISLVDGFNVPMDFLPVPTPGAPACRKGPRCAANITSQCPPRLQAPGGCNNACTGTNWSCEPSTYSLLFKRMCPDAYNDSDDGMKMFTCPTGTNYQVVFCPALDAASSPASSPNPPPLDAASSPASSPNPPALDAAASPSSSPNPPRQSGSRVRFILVLAGIVVVCWLIVPFVIFVVHRRRARRRYKDMEEEEEEFGNLLGTPVRFTFQQLEVATEQFRDKLGEGGFGTVFQGQIGEEKVAVKRLDQAGQGKREFLAEVQTIGSIHHMNVVRLIGFCAEKSHRFLVYEYMPKGSLDRWIYHQHDNGAPPLDWRTRCKIIMDIAKGLSYLHEECMKKIAHLDVKPQNILLDENFNAKVSDFGLCKLIDRDMSQVVTRMRGTPGYLAPEWLTSQITEKADIYSFGVVVMEIISGRKNLDTSQSEESIHLITLLEEKMKSDQLADLIDKQSNDMQVHKQEVIQMMKLAMWCLQIDCKKRPKMSEVVKVLEGTMDAETNIDHNFVATSPANFGIAGNVSSSASAPPLASDVSGPR